MERSIIVTSDGSSSIYVKDLNEHYHSVHGALTESKYVYIESGLKKIESNLITINILEIGLGTGLNCLLTYLENNRLNKKINYTAIEPFPLDMSMVGSLNYTNINELQLGRDVFYNIHTSAWEKQISLAEDFLLTKINNTIQLINLPQNSFNLVYFDAFAPKYQPEIWTREVFAKIYQSMHTNGILVTYCATGNLKRTLLDIGYAVEKIPGPPKKREMIRATKL